MGAVRVPFAGAITDGFPVRRSRNTWESLPCWCRSSSDRRLFGPDTARRKIIGYVKPVERPALHPTSIQPVCANSIVTNSVNFTYRNRGKYRYSRRWHTLVTSVAFHPSVQSAEDGA